MIRPRFTRRLLAVVVLTLAAPAGRVAAVTPTGSAASPKATAAKQETPPAPDDLAARRSQQRREDARRERAAEIESGSKAHAAFSLFIFVAVALAVLAAVAFGIWRLVYVLRRRKEVQTLREILAQKRADLATTGEALAKEIEAEQATNTVPANRDVLQGLEKRRQAIVAAGEESLDIAEKRIREDCVTADDRELQLLEVLELRTLQQQLRLHQLAAPAGTQRAGEQVNAVKALLASIEAGLAAARLAGLNVDSSALDMTRAQIASLEAEARGPDPRLEHIATGCTRVTRLLTAVHELISEARDQQLHSGQKGLQ